MLQARCRGELFTENRYDGDKVPISHEEQMSTLRQVFQAADRKERRERQQRRRPHGLAAADHLPTAPKCANPYAADAAATS